MKHWCFVCCVLFLAAVVGVGVGVPLAMMEDFITSPQERLTAGKRFLYIKYEPTNLYLLHRI